MRLILRNILLAGLLLGAAATAAHAQKPLKGTWIFNVTTPAGTLPIPLSFKGHGKGELTSPQGTMVFSYREKASAFSLTVEGPGMSPDGSDLTIVIRGTRTDNTVTGTVLFITDQADAASPIGYVAAKSTVTGSRQ